MKIEINRREVEVFGDYVEEAVASHQFQSWKRRLDKSFLVESIEIQSVDFVGEGDGRKVLFIKFTADVHDEEGNFIPGIVFMRGGAVAILVVLYDEDREYVVLTKQPRFPSGDFVLGEVPAGILDNDNHFVGAAARELREELEIEIDESNIIDLTPDYPYSPGVFSTPGGSDEFLRLFLYRQEMTESLKESLQGKRTGLEEEGEMITLLVVPIVLAERIAPDMKLLALLHLYDRWKIDVSPST